MEIAERVLRGNWVEGERDGPASPIRGPALRATRGSGTGTPASRRSSGGASSRRGRGRSWRPCSPPSAPTASSATRSSGIGRSRSPACPSTTSPRAAPSRRRRSSRRCWPGPGRSPSATRARSRGSPPRSTGSPPTATSRATACSGSSSPTSPGLDASPKFEPVWGWRANARPGFPLLVHRNRRLGFRRPAHPRARRAGPLRDPGQHALVALAAGAGPALGDAGPDRAALGRAPRALRRLGRARRRAARRSSPGPRSRRSPCPTCPRRSAGAWSRSTCSTSSEFLTPVAPPSVAASEPSYEPGGSRGPIRRYWRGPTWVNSAWLVWLGLRRLGYEEAAARLARWPDRRGRARRPARVLRPAHRRRARRRGLRLVGADCGVGRPEFERP